MKHKEIIYKPVPGRSGYIMNNMGVLYAPIPGTFTLGKLPEWWTLAEPEEEHEPETR